MVLDRAHVVVVDSVGGHEAPRVELQDGVVQGRLFHQLTGSGLQHLLADFHARGEGGREGGKEGGRGGGRGVLVICFSSWSIV